MLTQTVTITQNSTPNIIIGRRGTYETEQVVFDVSWLIDTYGAGSAVLMVHRPTDQTAYPVDVVLDGNTLTWTVSETDTQDKGHGECEIFWYVNDGLAKTCICGITILRDIGDTTETAPDPYETWVETLSRLGAETLTNAQAAAESAGNAAASATGALQSATDAGNAKNAAVAAAEAAASSASHYPQIVDGVWYVWSPTAGEYISTGIDAQGEDGVSPSVEITAIQGGHRVVITDADGPHTFDVLDGVTPDMSAYRTAADQDEIDDAQDEELNNLKSALNTKAGILRDTVSGSVASFTPDATIPNLLGVSVDIEPVQDLHGYDSPWPAGGGDNLLPDTGLTAESNGVKSVYANGRMTITGLATGSGGRNTLRTPNFSLKAGTYYFRKFQATGTPEPSAQVQNGSAIIGYASGSFTLESDSDSINIGFNVSSGNDYDYSVLLMVSSSEPSKWTPYSNICPISGRESVSVNANGTNHTIQLGETVYGGTLDVTNGTLTVDRAMVDLGTLTWIYRATDFADWPYFTAPVSGKKNGWNNGIMDAYRLTASQYDRSEDYVFNCVPYYSSGNVNIRDSRYTDAASFKAGVTGVKYCYELSTPITIQLDPVAISTIAGQTNNVWADAGDVTVEYAADLKTYIDSKIAAAVAALS